MRCPVQGQDGLHPRLLRTFVAVAEERHFSRAATRLYLTQQSVSRHVHQLEQMLGVVLFDRTTRQVELTMAGQRLLVGAKELLEAHEQVMATVLGSDQPLLVDLMGEGLTPEMVLDLARRGDHDVEFVPRFGRGAGASIRDLYAGRIDVAFGRTERADQVFDESRLSRRLVRLEPIGLLIADDHPWANWSHVHADALDGVEIDSSAGNSLAPEWTDLGEQFLALVGATPTAPHEHAEGGRETLRHLRQQGVPILAMTHSPTIQGAVLLHIKDPTPMYPWAMFHTASLIHPGLELLHAACDHAIDDLHWGHPPLNSWVPPSDLAAFDL